MGSSRATTALLIGICAMLSCAVLSCSENESTGPHASTDAIFTLIEWPDKYEQDGAGLSNDYFNVHLNKIDSNSYAFCWATYSYKECADDLTEEQFATEYHEFNHSQSISYSMPYYELRRAALNGMYTIRVGLCGDDTAYLFDESWANETQSYSKYVGEAHYSHDVEFEYIWQSTGYDDYEVFDKYSHNWDEVTEPFRNTLVHFAKVDCDSNPVPAERIRSRTVSMDFFVSKYASTWPAAPNVRKFRYFLCGVEAMLSSDGQNELDVLGQTETGLDLSFVAVRKINDLFNYYIHEIKISVAAHEFGFAVGAGQPAFCDHPDSHTVGFNCLMGGLGYDSQGYPYWVCPGDTSVTQFNGTAEFCPDCIWRLNEVDFLVVDY